jgi:(S)-2-hydroxy-acid oxidase
MDSILSTLDILLAPKEENSTFKSNILELRKLKNRIIKHVDEAINLDEIERLAYSKLDFNALSFFMGGANSEHTLKRNIDYFHKIMLYPKVLKDVSKVDLSCNIFGNKLSMPILIGPTALHKLAHPDAEIATSSSAREKNTIYCRSIVASSSFEEIAKVNKNSPRWLQIYIFKSREETLNLIREAEKNGFSALVVTVDQPVMGQRERDFQSKFLVPDPIEKEIWGHLTRYIKNNTSNITKDHANLKTLFFERQDDGLTLEVVPWLKKNTNLKIILKGIYSVDVALKAREMGADAIIVSNHGGRQLDKVPSSIEMLYPICKALRKDGANKMEVYVDGGIRRGSDVFKALAMGAKAVLIGRPVIWGLASDGKNGVNKVLDLLKNELFITMKLAGCTKLEDINEDYIKVSRTLAKF